MFSVRPYVDSYQNRTFLLINKRKKKQIEKAKNLKNILNVMGPTCKEMTNQNVQIMFAGKEKYPNKVRFG